MPRHGQASETSPLLGPATIVPSDAGSEEAANGALPVSSGSEPHAAGGAPSKVADARTSADEGPASSNGESGEYQGLPELKKRLAYIVPALSIGVFLSALDQTLVASSAGKIGSDLNALQNTSWVATAYFLTLTSFQPLYGKLSDIFGRKTCLLSAYVIFGLGTLWCGTSTSMGSLIAARAFAGIGGGGMTTCVSILMSDIVPLRERGTWQGIINIVYSAGSGIGAPLGGYLADTIGWQWSFIGQFPVCVLAFVMVSLFLKLPQNDKSHWKEKVRRVDFPGAIALVSAVTVLLIGLDRGSNKSWKSPVTITCLSVSLPLVLGFAYIETRIAGEPFAPGRVILPRSQLAAYLCNFFAFAGWFGVLFYMPLFYQAVFGLSATAAGVHLLPGIIASVTGSLIAGLIIQKTGRYYWLTVGSYITLSAGAIVMLLFIGHLTASNIGLFTTSDIGISVGLAVGGLGGGSGVTVSLIALLSNATVQDQALTTACSYLFRSLGSVLGLSIQAAAFQNILRVRLEQRLGSGAEAARLADRVRQSLDYVRRLDPRTRVIVAQAYREATVGVFALITGLAACSVVFSCESPRSWIDCGADGSSPSAREENRGMRGEGRLGSWRTGRRACWYRIGRRVLAAAFLYIA